MAKNERSAGPSAEWIDMNSPNFRRLDSAPLAATLTPAATPAGDAGATRASSPRQPRLTDREPSPGLRPAALATSEQLALQAARALTCVRLSRTSYARTPHVQVVPQPPMRLRAAAGQAPQLVVEIGTEPSRLRMVGQGDGANGHDALPTSGPRVRHLLGEAAARQFLAGFVACGGPERDRAVALSLAVGFGKAGLVAGLVLLAAGMSTLPADTTLPQRLALVLPAVVLLGALLPASREYLAYRDAAQRFAQLYTLAEGHAELCNGLTDVQLQETCATLALQLRGTSDPVLRLAIGEWSTAHQAACGRRRGF